MTAPSTFLRRAVRPIALFGALAVGVAAPAVAQAPGLTVLAKLNKGSWVLRDRSDNASQRVCLRSGAELLQRDHAAYRCKRFVVADEARTLDVQYTCPGHGYGRTTIRFENPELIQMQTQGIRDGRPFNRNMEARRVGSC